MASVDFSLPRATHISIIDSRQLLPDEEKPEVDPATGAPQQLRAFVVSQDPKISVLPQFMSAEECDHLVKLVEGNWMPSLVGGPPAKDVPKDSLEAKLQNKPSQNRTSWSCQMRYAQTAIVERLEHRLASVAGLRVSQFERMNMVRYAPGELFNEHHDGKFRPITVFVYLNDLDEDDDQGDTFFPVIGFSFRPRKGTAVVWGNARPDGKEDSRMLHAGRAPRKCIKYGVNCFFNDKDLRSFVEAPDNLPLSDAAVVRVAELAEQSGDEPSDDPAAKLHVYRVSQDPHLVAVPNFLTQSEASQLLSMAGVQGVHDLQQTIGDGPFDAGTHTVRLIDYDETQTVTDVEARICAISSFNIDHLAKLRVVRTGTVLGLCNRGSGHKSVYVCLSPQDEVFFPKLGLRFILRCGDALVWPNINTDDGIVIEDLRTQRVHLGDHQGGAAVSVLGLDAFLHDNPVREQQKQREFVPDSAFQQSQ
mmetsp:Transcript_43632/g.102907  ORF Transcript_43632/g.102907 Transcript_43632/m.102907 type:complete len:476 (+) Transcript_43632:126-1553(+)